MNGRPWQPHELAWLRDWYGVLAVEDLAQLLRRGLAGVKSKCLEQGLRCRTTWSPELDEFMSLLFPDTAATVLGPAIGATPAAVRQRAAQLGLKKAPGFSSEMSRKATLARSRFTPEIAEIIELLYPDALTDDIADLVGLSKHQVHAYAHRQGWKKTTEFVRATARARTGPDHPLIKFRFPKGSVPPNKGVKGWQSGGRSIETQFKKGQRPSTWKPIGSHRINADGYLDRKVSDTGYPPRDWVPVHRLLWIEANGPVPVGHLLRFKPGMKTAVPELLTLDRIECISRREHVLRNSWHTNFPPELKQLVSARSSLTRIINRRQRELEQTP